MDLTEVSDGKIGFIEVFAKIAIYYAHERAWMHIPFGRA